LYSSGITREKHLPEIDKKLPEMYNVGITNLIARPTRCASELSRSEMLLNVDVVESKIREYRPRAVCVVGKGIWEIIYERKHLGRKLGREFVFGWQGEPAGKEDKWEGAMCFVTPSTSGRVASYSRQFQEGLWAELGEWVKEQRGEGVTHTFAVEEVKEVEVKTEWEHL
jgi:thymine-DNA glycosylase